MRNRYIYGVKNDTLNKEIIEKCGLEDYESRYRILEHFYHTDTYIDNQRARLVLISRIFLFTLITID